MKPAVEDGGVELVVASQQRSSEVLPHSSCPLYDYDDDDHDDDDDEILSVLRARRPAATVIALVVYSVIITLFNHLHSLPTLI